MITYLGIVFPLRRTDRSELGAVVNSLTAEQFRDVCKIPAGVSVDRYVYYDGSAHVQTTYDRAPDDKYTVHQVAF
jgi:hypothetical protein